MPRSPPARSVAGRRVTSRAAPAQRFSRQPPCPEPQTATPNPEPWSLDSRLLSHSSASCSGHSYPIAPYLSPEPAQPSVPILTLNSAASGDNSHKLFPVTPYVHGMKATLLIDSGASRDFISADFVKANNLR